MRSQMNRHLLTPPVQCLEMSSECIFLSELPLMIPVFLRGDQRLIFFQRPSTEAPIPNLVNACLSPRNRTPRWN